MADEFLPPLVAQLLGDATGYNTMLAESEARMTAFVESQTVALGELDARMAAMGAGVGGGATAGAQAAEVTAAQTEIQASMTRTSEEAAAASDQVAAADDRIAASFAAVGASADKMAEQHYLAVQKMRAQTLQLTADMEAADAKAAASTAAVGDAMAGTAAKTEASTATLGMSKTALLGVGAAAIGVAYETTKMAGDFNMATTRLVTSAGETQQNLDMVRQGILGMAGAVGYSSAELAKAMYTVESGGQHGAAGLKVLQAAAEGAKTENADLGEVADAVTSVLQDYHLKASDAADVTSKLVAATSQGKTTFEQLAASMSSVLPVASANHVSLNDILGDLASMTVHGMSAQQAAQNLTDAIRHMASPTMAQSKELAALGLNATEVSKNLGEQGLSGTIQQIAQRIQSQMGPAGMVVVNLTNALKGLPPPVQKLGEEVLNGTTTLGDFTKAAKELDPLSAKQAQSFATLAGSMHTIGTESKSGAEVYQSYAGAMQKAMGDATGLNVALMLTGENSATTANAIKVVSGATAQADGHVKGWSEIQGEFNQQLSQAKDAMGALAISIGEKILPVITPMIHALASAAQWLSQHKIAAEILAGVIGGVLLVALSAAAVAVGAFVAGLSATVWIIAGVAAAVGGAAYLIVTHWDQVKKYFAALGAWMDMNVIQPLVQVWRQLWPQIKPHIDALVSTVMDAWRKLSDWTRDNWGTIKDVIDFIFKVIVPLVKANLDSIVNDFELSFRLIGDVLSTALHVIVDVIDMIIDILRGLIRIGEGIVEFWHGVFTGNWREAWNGIKDVVGGAVDVIKGILGGIWNVGRDLVIGLWNGIKDVGSWLYDQVKSWAKGILDAAKAALGISSPSTETFEQGRFLALGLASGIDAHTSLAVEAAQRMARAVLGGANPGSLSVSGPGVASAVSGQALANTVISASGAGGGQVVNLQVTVQGSVWTTGDLVREIQTQLLQHNIRNPSNATTWSFA